MKRSFCINMWQWMKNGSTTTLWTQIGSQLSGQQEVKAIQSNQRCKHLHAKHVHCHFCLGGKSTLSLQIFLHFLNQFQRFCFCFLFKKTISSIYFFCRFFSLPPTMEFNLCLEFTNRQTHLRWLRQGYTTSMPKSGVGFWTPANFRFSEDNT